MVLRLLEVAVDEMADRGASGIQITYARFDVDLLHLRIDLRPLELLLGSAHLLVSLIQLISQIHYFILVFS